MSMIEHIPELIENGVDSFKIEGRMKSIHYVSTVSNVYKAAVDSYMEDPENYVCKQEWEMRSNFMVQDSLILAKRLR